jgi:hypothetical protein
MDPPRQALAQLKGFQGRASPSERYFRPAPAKHVTPHWLADDGASDGAGRTWRYPCQSHW